MQTLTVWWLLQLTTENDDITHDVKQLDRLD